VRVLAMEVDQALADLLQLRERRLPAVDPRAAPAVTVERAAQQQRWLILGEILGVEPGADIGMAADIELRGELGAVGTGSQLTQFEAVSQQQSQRVEEDRLARAGLAGQHREAAGELELECFDDDEIAYGQQP
jgi:hypothetical protein